MKLPMYNHCLATYWNYKGFTLVGSWNCACKATVLPLIGIKWGTHWSAHETAYIIPLFYHTFVKQNFYRAYPLSWPKQYPWLNKCGPHISYVGAHPWIPNALPTWGPCWFLNGKPMPMKPMKPIMGSMSACYLGTLVQIMVCRLFGAKPLSEPVMTYCELDLVTMPSFHLNHQVR